jgi:hypothetical protein
MKRTFSGLLKDKSLTKQEGLYVINSFLKSSDFVASFHSGWRIL